MIFREGITPYNQGFCSPSETQLFSAQWAAGKRFPRTPLHWSCATCRQMLTWEEGVDFKMVTKEVPYPIVQEAKMIATRNKKHKQKLPQ